MAKACHETLNLLRTRRSAALKTLGGPAPSEAELAEMLTVAARVPDHAKLVPWRFVVIDERARERLRGAVCAAFVAGNPGATPEAVHEAGAKLGTAPLIVAVVMVPRQHPKVPEVEQTLSAGAVCMNLLLAARAMGYGAVWLTEWFAYHRGVLAEMGLGATERLAGLVHIGTEPATPREDRPRPDMGAIVGRM